MDVSNEDELFKRLKTDITDTIDLLFIDHEKSRYLTDLIAFERSGLMTKGTIVVADNILSLGIPLSDYIDHVKDENGLYISSETKTASLEYSRANNTIKTVEVDGSDISLDDGIEISIFK
jgi:predicted O-methyltransferase YrrM